jgi:hypothetical protein
LLGYAVDFEQTQARILAVSDLERRLPARRDRYCVYRFVKLVAVKGFALYDMVLARRERIDKDSAACISGVAAYHTRSPVGAVGFGIWLVSVRDAASDKLTVCAAHFKDNARERPAGCFVRLDDKQA